MDQRKWVILKAIIEEYIHTASPVGSRTISKQEGVNLSSATIRNEMSDLEGMGYLIQPHASAGRIPSAKAYRMYVDWYIEEGNASVHDIEYIHQLMKNKLIGAENIVNQTAAILAEITQYPSLVMAPSWNKISVKRIQLVPVAENKALLVIISEIETVHNKVITIPPGFTAEQLESFSRMLTERLEHQKMEDAIQILSKEFPNEYHQQRKFFEDVSSAFRQSFLNDSIDKIAIGGATKILLHPEFNDIGKAKEMFDIFETKADLLKTIDIYSDTSMQISIKIGPENTIKGFEDVSLVGCNYNIHDMGKAFFGIVGPTRMDYAKVISALQTFALCMEDILKEDNNSLE